MRRVAGSLLIAVGTVCMAATLFWMGQEIAHPPRGLNEDQGNAIFAGFLFGGALVMLESIIFLTGCHLWRPCPDTVAEGKRERGGGHLLALTFYLVGSIAVAVFAATVTTGGYGGSAALRSLWFLTCQPSMLAQAFLGSMWAVTFGVGVMAPGPILFYDLLYFIPFFYPAYRMITMDRTVEVICYRRMKTLLMLFCGAHLLIGLMSTILLRA